MVSCVAFERPISRSALRWICSIRFVGSRRPARPGIVWKSAARKKTDARNLALLLTRISMCAHRRERVSKIFANVSGQLWKVAVG